MKKFFLDECLKLVRNSYSSYDEDRLDEIRYGLEALYLTITKLIVVVSISFILGVWKETLLLCLFFNILRTSGFGIHAKKSWMCWVSSCILFLGLPYLCSILIIPKNILFIIGIFCEINLLLFAPADTEKRPLIHKKRRMIWKIITGISGLTFIFLICYSKSTLIQNTLLCAMLIESALVNPLVYKFFRLPYNNYETYTYSTN